LAFSYTGRHSQARRKERWRADGKISRSIAGQACGPRGSKRRLVQAFERRRFRHRCNLLTHA
jgi:hypothetical protein